MGLYKPGSSKPIPLGEFAPDDTVIKPGILLDAVGAMPTQGGFSPMNGYTGLAPALGGRPMGSHFAFYSNDSTTLFVAIDTGAGLAFYTLDTNTSSWVSVTGPTVTPALPVRFAQYGNDVLVVGGIATDGVWRAPNITGNFAALVGSPAFATVITVINNQVLAFVEDNWFTSAAGDDTDWTLSLATRADTGVLTDSPGPVVAAVPLFRNAIVFKKNATYIGTQGFPSALDFQLVSTSTGTWSQGCVIAAPTAVYFLGIDDFYVITGYTPERIPNNVKQWFFRTVDPNYIDQTLGWFDEANSVLYWHFVSREAPFPPTCDRFVSYNVRARRWCNGRLDVSSIPYLAGETSVLPNPGRPAIFIDGGFVAEAFTILPGNMVLTTGYMGDPGRLSQLMRVLPLYNRYPCQQTLTPLCTDVLGQPDKASEPAVLGVDGWFYHRQYERYHKLVMGMTGDCEIFAIEPEFRAGGLWGYGVDVPCVESRLSVESDLQPTNGAGANVVPTYQTDGEITGFPPQINLIDTVDLSSEVVCPSSSGPGAQTIGVGCCYVSSGWDGLGSTTHGMFAFAAADGSFWCTSSLASGFSSGPYPIATPSQTWFLLEPVAPAGPSCALQAVTAIPLTGGKTANFQSTQTPQGGTCGHSDEKCYLLTLSSINPPVWPIANGPGFIGFPGATTAIVFFGENTGVNFLLSSFNGAIETQNAWCKFSDHLYSVNKGASPNIFCSWPLGNTATYEDLSVNLTAMLPGWVDATFDQQNSISMIHATTTYLYVLAHGPWSGGASTYRVFQILRSNLTYVQHWVINDANFTAPWGLHAFSDDLIFLIQGQWKIGYLLTATGATAVIDTVGQSCTQAGNAVGSPGQSAFVYSKNYFYLSYSGLGFGNSNVLKLGPLTCPGNPNLPFET